MGTAQDYCGNGYILNNACDQMHANDENISSKGLGRKPGPTESEQRLMGIIGSATDAAIVGDVSGRKRAEEAMRDGEERYRTLFEYAPDGILIADSNSYYIDANPSMCRLLGYTREELVGLHASKIVTPAEIRHIEPALNELNAGSDHGREWQFLRKDGSSFTAEVIATMMPDGNLMGMIRDVTERNGPRRPCGRARDGCGPSSRRPLMPSSPLTSAASSVHLIRRP